MANFNNSLSFRFYPKSKISYLNQTLPNHHYNEVLNRQPKPRIDTMRSYEQNNAWKQVEELLPKRDAP